MSDASELEALRAEVAALTETMLHVNDAALNVAGVVCRIVFDHGLITREALADELLRKAGREGTDDYNPVLHAFARSVRMNFPGGRFELIPGGLSETD